MKLIFQSLRRPAADGVELFSADGRVRRCYPLLAGASLDYPEQCLVAGVRYGECPICGCTPDSLGDYVDSPRRTQTQTLRILALSKLRPTQTAIDDFLKSWGIAPIFKPFWERHPHTDIHSAITPDILHQIYQGLVRHLTKWIQRLIGPKEFDQRLARLPPNHPLRIYNHGISSFSNMSGNEHRQITKQLIGCIVGIVNPQTVRATRSLLDFIYLAQYQSHSDDTLGYLEEALKLFHTDKNVFIFLNARESMYSPPFNLSCPHDTDLILAGDNFNLPKLHSLLHYVPSITEIGTTDNCNTETTERLHIDYAKEAYRASNKKEFMPQMIIWLSRVEKIERHVMHVRWREGLDKPATTEPTLHLRLTKNPSAKAVTIPSLATAYHAHAFTSSLRTFLQRFTPHQSSASHIPFITALNNLDSLRFTLPVWHRIRIVNHSIQDVEGVTDRTDTVHAAPERKNRAKVQLAERFDTGLIDENGTADAAGLSGKESHLS